MPASEPHTRTAEAAEKVRQAAQTEELDRWAKDLLETLPELPPLLPTTPHPGVWTCTCPPFTTCMNVSCPRRTRITC